MRLVCVTSTGMRMTDEKFAISLALAFCFTYQLLIWSRSYGHIPSWRVVNRRKLFVV